MNWELRNRAMEFAHRFETEWGAFRRFIATRPLTSFWMGVALGAGSVYLAGLL